VINKVDLADAVGASMEIMKRDANLMRDGGPVIFAQVKYGPGVDEIMNYIEKEFLETQNNSNKKQN
jgi:urease accessory protein